MPSLLENRLARLALAVLIIDLEYDYAPVHGLAPIRHQLLWEWAAQTIGEDATRDLATQLCSDVMEGKNGPVKTNPLKEEELRYSHAHILSDLVAQVLRASMYAMILGRSAMIDLGCRACQARRKSVLREHYERMIAIHEGHLARLIELRESHEQFVIRRAEWEAEQLADLREDYYLQLHSLNKQYEASVMQQAEWRVEQLEIVEGLHAEHAGGNGDAG